MLLDVYCEMPDADHRHWQVALCDDVPNDVVVKVTQLVINIDELADLAMSEPEVFEETRSLQLASRQALTALLEQYGHTTAPERQTV